MKTGNVRLWAVRLLIAVVIAWNLQAAFSMIARADLSAAAFELQAVPGRVAVQGMGILFIMWNIPYMVACWQPQKQRLSLWEAAGMQTIGVIGELAIFFTLPEGHALLTRSLQRFIAFDVAGMPSCSQAGSGNKNPR
jgi:hypothetical protein